MAYYSTLISENYKAEDAHFHDEFDEPLHLYVGTRLMEHNFTTELGSKEK
jgi:hypothetical protein